ncbi:RAF-like serine/threonine-protein kinase 20 [Silene latifolia]|uniref:RAF-like serine/threonine-protein kinase 20 n=1 Tax=Silene latifolia TaxID=37657 RepID=UPI003D7828FC
MVVEEKNEGGDEESALSQLGTVRVKFFCSHGGKILPRPSDGTLKYVGGETRAVAVPRSISFSELMNKMNDLFDGEYVLKYQIAKEDLDSLVSVKCDEDIRHMLDEYDRLEQAGPSKLRTFLFPVNPVVVSSLQSRLTRVNRVQSSPNLCSLSARHILPATPYQHNYYHGCQSPDHHHSPSWQGYQSPITVHGGRSEYNRAPPLMGHHNAMSIRYPGSGGHRRWGHLEQYSTQCASLPRSPADLWEF